jgi:hypothetical protein
MRCCKIKCDKPAEYEIWHGPHHDDYTHSCLAHIPDLMTDAKEHRIVTLQQIIPSVGCVFCDLNLIPSDGTHSLPGGRQALCSR